MVQTGCLAEWYYYLWLRYLDDHPELAEYASQFDVFNDMFRGKSMNCQTDCIQIYVKEGREALAARCSRRKCDFVDGLRLSTLFPRSSAFGPTPHQSDE